MTHNQQHKQDDRSLSVLLASLEAQLKQDEHASVASLADIEERRRHYRNLLLAQAFGVRYPN